MRTVIALILIVCAAGVLTLVAAKGMTRMSVKTYVENLSGDAPNRLTVSITVTGDGDALASWNVDGMKGKSVSGSWFGMVGSVTVALDSTHRSTWLSVGASKTVRFEREAHIRFKVIGGWDGGGTVTRVIDVTWSQPVALARVREHRRRADRPHPPDRSLTPSCPAEVGPSCVACRLSRWEEGLLRGPGRALRRSS